MAEIRDKADYNTILSPHAPRHVGEIVLERAASNLNIKKSTMESEMAADIPKKDPKAVAALEIIKRIQIQVVNSCLE